MFLWTINYCTIFGINIHNFSTRNLDYMTSSGIAAAKRVEPPIYNPDWSYSNKDISFNPRSIWPGS